MVQQRTPPDQAGIAGAVDGDGVRTRVGVHALERGQLKCILAAIPGLVVPRVEIAPRVVGGEVEVGRDR